MVQAILRTFPGAKLETVRRKGDHASLVADLVGPRDEPVVEDYPADDDIPESEF
jgi:DNA polymerase III subunit gamma/tau